MARVRDHLGRYVGPRTPTTLDELLALTVSNPTGCWEWQGYRDPVGYGRICRTLMHRHAWKLAHGDIPVGLCVLHRCDNPPCVNVDHLFLGTQADNLRDMTAKGRRRHGHPVGEQSCLAKLTAEQVLAIRARAATGERQAHLAREYGITRQGVYRIVRRLCWRHLEAA